MRKLLLCAFLLFLVGTSVAEAGSEKRVVVKRHAAHTCATLPDGVRFPEGITADPYTGHIYVSTFDFGNPNKLLRFNKHCDLVAVRDFGGTPLLGLAFNTRDDKVYIANFGASKIQRIAADFNDVTPIEDVATIPGIGAPLPRTEGNPDGSTDTIIFGSNSFPAPNALTFNWAGDLFVSDSFQGAIFRINSADSCATPCAVVTVKQHPLLATAGFPPFGANGIVFNSDESQLFIANTGDDRILRLPMAGGDPVVFAESINGADGLAYGGEGYLWVAANQADEIVVLNSNGRVIAKLGDFFGIHHDGSPDGLLFPASLVIVGKWVYVTNLALPLTGGDEPEADVTKWTISRIRIPDELSY